MSNPLAQKSGEYWDKVAAGSDSEARYWLGVMPVRRPSRWQTQTEMIRSGEIEREHLDVVEWMPYYGNVLNPLVCSIRSSALELPEIAEVLDEAMQLEDYLIEHGLLKPLYAACVARAR